MNLPKNQWADCEQRWQTVITMNMIARLTGQFIHGLDDEGRISEINPKRSINTGKY